MRTSLTRLLLAACVGVSGTAARAESFHEGFEGESVSWRLESETPAAGLLEHSRLSSAGRERSQAEVVQLKAGGAGAEIALSHPLPPAIAIPDLTLKLWVRSNQAGHRLCMRVVLPAATDPATGEPLSVLLIGDRYDRAHEWQQLSCVASDEATQEALRRVRYQVTGRSLSTEGLYVDRAVLTATGPAQADLVLALDDLDFGPIVPPSRTPQPVGMEPTAAADDRPVEFRLNRLVVEGKPFFPIIAPFHGEAGDTVEEFAATGANVAWVPDWRDDALLASLRAGGLWATALPPRATGDSGEVLEAHEAGLPPFGPETRPILFWNLGPRIPAYTLEELIGWVNQLRAADGAYERPTLADVTGGEYAFSSHVDMLAASRHVTGTSIPYESYRDLLKASRSEAFLNTFFWTWIQTEPTAQIAAARHAAGQSPIVIEPEQLRLQVYAALQAGCRGIGYWKTMPFSADTPGADERRLSLARLSMELKLLEPLLATGDKPGVPVAFDVAQPRPGSDGRRVRPAYHQLTMNGPRAAETAFAPSERPPGRADAVMLQTGTGPLLVAVWYGEGAQFCPGQMTKNDVKIIVPGVSATATAWLLTPTGIDYLPARQVAGGREITLPKFDQTAAVLFTADASAIEPFRRMTSEMAPQAAQVALDLAKAKRRRVFAIHHELTTLAPPLPDGAALIKRIDSLIASAEKSLAANAHDAARQSADDALQALRALQRAHWEDAVREFPSPLASPHGVSFSTLPDHYRLIAQVGRALLKPPTDANLLPTGGFEESDEMIAEGWRYTAFDSEDLVPGAALIADSPKVGRYSLQLVTRPRENRPGGRTAGGGSATFQSPPMPVTAGQVVHVSGWVRVVGEIPTHLDGATLHDSLLGPSGGLRWTRTDGWKPFQMLREVPGDGAFELTLTLHGEGEVHFDDLKVIAHTPRAPLAQEPGNASIR